MQTFPIGRGYTHNWKDAGHDNLRFQNVVKLLIEMYLF